MTPLPPVDMAVVPHVTEFLAAAIDAVAWGLLFGFMTRWLKSVGGP